MDSIGDQICFEDSALVQDLAVHCDGDWWWRAQMVILFVEKKKKGDWGNGKFLECEGKMSKTLSFFYTC